MYEYFVAFSAIPWNAKEVIKKRKKKVKPVFVGGVCQAYTMSPTGPALNMSHCLLSITHLDVFFMSINGCLNLFFIPLFFTLWMWLYAPLAHLHCICLFFNTALY